MSVNPWVAGSFTLLGGVIAAATNYVLTRQNIRAQRREAQEERAHRDRMAHDALLRELRREDLTRFREAAHTLGTLSRTTIDLWSIYIQLRLDGTPEDKLPDVDPNRRIPQLQERTREAIVTLEMAPRGTGEIAEAYNEWDRAVNALLKEIPLFRANPQTVSIDLGDAIRARTRLLAAIRTQLAALQAEALEPEDTREGLPAPSEPRLP
jgi:hypothetical protein